MTNERTWGYEISAMISNKLKEEREKAVEAEKLYVSKLIHGEIRRIKEELEKYQHGFEAPRFDIELHSQPYGKTLLAETVEYLEKGGFSYFPEKDGGHIYLK